MTVNEYREFDDASFSRFRRRLLRTKGGPQQRSFLQSVRSDEEFLRVVGEQIVVRGSLEPKLCPAPLTENEFKQPPSTTEQKLYNAWSGLTPRVACRTTFWANLTFRHVEDGRIEAAYLAANGQALSGVERIDRVLQGNGDGAATAIDRCVRTVLRRLGGLPEARGNKSVYVDCPFGRAWWRERLVGEVSNGDHDLADKVREVTRVNQTYWERLVVLVVSRNSVLGSRAVRDQFILSLAEFFDKEPNTSLRHEKNLRAACKMIGVIQGSRELSVLERDELRSLMDDVVRLQHIQGGRVQTDG